MIKAACSNLQRPLPVSLPRQAHLEAFSNLQTPVAWEFSSLEFEINGLCNFANISDNENYLHLGCLLIVDQYN
ncbi:MAG TPA: hypothetical protein VK658_26625 [Chryseolinea sp.]|nr:hypothetical protein [Chryseolinea sp.]